MRSRDERGYARAHVSRKGLVGLGVATGMLCLIAWGCAPQASAPEAPGSANANVGQAADDQLSGLDWTTGTDCSMCHAEQHASTTDAALRASVHATQAQATCASCHNDEAALVVVHEGATADAAMPKKLKETTVSAEACQAEGCHVMSDDEFRALTADVTELTDSKQTTVNPHDVIGLTAGHADIACNDCHSEHKADAGAATTCVSCHHAGVYECNTCH